MGKLTRVAFEELISQNREWLAKTPDCLERRHIDAILAEASNHYYSDAPSEIAALKKKVARYESVLANLLPFSSRVERGVETGNSLGRSFLSVNGVVVAMEGDICRDPKYGNSWTEEDLIDIEKSFNEPILSALEET